MDLTPSLDASGKKNLYDDFVLFATDLCNKDLAMCKDLQEINQENCVIEIVKRCLREMNNNFLWVFDNVKIHKDIKDYIPNESGISGIILITTQNKAEFANYDENVDLNEGMTDKESCILLNHVIQEAAKKSNVPVFCSKKEIKQIAVDIWGNLPLPIVYTGKLIGDHIRGNCKEYLEMHALDPQAVRMLVKDLNVNKFKLQEEAIGEQIRFLEKLNLKLNLYVIGLLSFVKFPLSENLILDYINATNRCREILGITTDSYQQAELAHKINKIKISNAIDKFSLVKVSNGRLAFPHELFNEQVHLFFLDEDEKTPGSYKQLFNEVTEFLCQKFSGNFWDKVAWKIEKETLLVPVENMVNIYMLDNHSAINAKLRPFNDSQFTLWYRLAKSYIESNPTLAVKLFDELLMEMENGTKRETTSTLSNLFIFNWISSSVSEKNLSWYAKDSIEYANVMYYLAVANCQAQYYGADFDFNRVEELAEKAYNLFKNRLGKENPKILNVYLLLAHIRIHLKGKTPFEKYESYKVEFPESEPTIDAAIDLIDLSLMPNDLDSFRKKLSSIKELSSKLDYPSIYTKLEEKMESSRQGKEDL